MNEFDDIRPYSDAEVSGVVQRILADNEFVDLIARFRGGSVGQLLRGPLLTLVRPFVRNSLVKQFGGIDSVASMQDIVESYMTKMIERSTDGFEVRGLNALDLTKPHLFISNHRDITLDPAFTNFALHRNGAETVRIAIGDNLLTKNYASDLMRLNKSFIVRRAISKPRELLRSLLNLSRYIAHSISTDKHSVWIAQREGRAKDGVDRTEAAVLKMIFLGKPKTASFEQYLNDLRIVPVSIAYEFDPCLALKTRELKQTQAQEQYEKAEHEDLASIGQGISGYKGRVCIHFGKRLQGLDSIESLTEVLDKDICANYRLFANNFFAYQAVYGQEACQPLFDKQPDFNAQELQDAALKSKFEAHIASLPQDEQTIALNSYANPLVALSAMIPNA